ncbi:Oxidoreductase UcpA [BD1-7 clade bacterium]|uniref:Oxidoreductase UcpA n=1 Tax=BD1-7 clade bacterium TaxID=2029982 RepID=A0A5S9PYF3_9GAMM|nr:Oxidoreductase UcpA [BD1-7 clade bacterium]
MVDRDTLPLQYGPWALITGASAHTQTLPGTGEAYAHQLARQGFNLVLIARNAQHLNLLAETLHNKYGIQTRTVCVDLTDPDLWHTLKPQTIDLDIGLMVLNATYTASGEFFDVSIDAKQQAIEINCTRTVEFIESFGASMKSRGRGAIVIVSSIAATYGQRNYSMYGAIKAFQQNLGEAIWSEFRQHGIDVITALPGPIKNANFRRIKTHKQFFAFGVEPADVASISLAHLGKGPSVRISAFAHGIFWLQRCLPRRIIVAVVERYIGWLYRS